VASSAPSSRATPPSFRDDFAADTAEGSRRDRAGSVRQRAVPRQRQVADIVENQTGSVDAATEVEVSVKVKF
jgi:hypothetical protein